MIKSMTGFGRSEQIINGKEITVEIKSVNHRYFEFNCRCPRGMGFLDDKIKNFLQQKISRGKVDVYVSIGNDDEKEAVVTVNHSLAGGYVNALKELADTYNIPNDTTVSSLARYSDIFTVHKAPDDEDKLWEDVKLPLEDALNKFIGMRESEGEKMYKDISDRCQTILNLVSQVEERSPKTVEEYKNKLTQRINEFLEGASVDEQRIITEVAIFADKVAVAEETVRLRSHFEQLADVMAANVPAGRKIDFILQEMNRETNTIGSKVQDAQLAHIVVDIKSELEKIREQVQNIE